MLDVIIVLAGVGSVFGAGFIAGYCHGSVQAAEEYNNRLEELLDE